jgi:hypothetical protein
VMRRPSHHRALVRARLRDGRCGVMWRHVASCETGGPLLRDGWGVPRGRRLGSIAFFFGLFFSSCPWHCMTPRDMARGILWQGGGCCRSLGTHRLLLFGVFSFLLPMAHCSMTPRVTA